jgi:hypothetical protein
MIDIIYILYILYIYIVYTIYILYILYYTILYILCYTIYIACICRIFLDPLTSEWSFAVVSFFSLVSLDLLLDFPLVGRSYEVGEIPSGKLT